MPPSVLRDFGLLVRNSNDVCQKVAQKWNETRSRINQYWIDNTEQLGMEHLGIEHLDIEHLDIEKLGCAQPWSRQCFHPCRFIVIRLQSILGKC